MQKIDYHRVLNGSDTIVHDIAWEMGRLLSFDLPDEQITAILGLFVDLGSLYYIHGRIQ